MNTELIISENDQATVRQCRIILISALITAALYTLCFKGSDVTASLSSVIFFNGMSVGLYFMLKLLGISIHKKAFLLAVPIALLSLFNAYFEYSYYNIFNCIGFYIIFSVMTIKAAGLSTKVYLDSFLSLTFNNCFKATGETTKNISCPEINTSRLKRAVMGFILSLPVLIIITLLLINGDDAFCEAIEGLLNIHFDFGSFLWTIIVFGCVAVYFCGYLYGIITRSKHISFNGCHADNTMALSFLTPVNALFVFFCISQLSYLKNGMQIPEFTTYSRYVREGFFQLLAVTFINFTIVLAFTEVIKNFKHRAVKLSLVLLCVFTFVLILSSYYRMYLYINAYGFTPLRIEVLTFLTAEVILVFTTIHSILRERCDIISGFVVLTLISLTLLNVIARPEFSAYLNNNYGTRDYMGIEYYDHTEIPLLIDKYNNSHSRSEKTSICARLYEIDNYSQETEHWQSVSVQWERNESMMKEFLKNRIK